MDTAANTASALDRARRKAFWHIMPLCFICYVLSYVDRTNISLAKLTMKADLPWLNDGVFGQGAGLFFPGYVLLGVPGALLVEKWSARKLVTASMLAWGVVAVSMAFIETKTQFYTLRFLLGLTEAAFFPGMLVYLTHWFPSRDRAQATASLLVATPVAQICSPKITGAMLAMTALGMKGWQWVFICWGAPAVLLGLIVFFGLSDRPRHATWLDPDERDALEQELDRELIMGKARKRGRFTDAFRHPKVWLLALAYFLAVTANYGLEFFQASIFKSWYGIKLDSITSLVILPPLAALVGQLVSGWHSDLKKERRLHTVVPMVFGAVALFGAASSKGALALTVVMLVAAAAGIKSYQPSFWALPPLLLSEAAAAGSIGIINGIGNLGGWLGSSLMGYVQVKTGSYEGGLQFLGGSLFLSAILVLGMGVGRKAEA